MSVSQSGGMAMESFEVVCRVGGEPVFSFTTSFGHFLHEALAQQVGLPTSDDQRRQLTETSEHTLDMDRLRSPLTMPAPPILMSERRHRLVAAGRRRGPRPPAGNEEGAPRGMVLSRALLPGSGPAGLARGRGPAAAPALLRDRTWPPSRFRAPALESPAEGQAITWKYRGQVRPWNHEVVLGIDVKAVDETPESTLVVADG